MPFIVLLVGVVLVITGIRGTTSQLAALLKGDFTGTPNFGIWLLALFGIGALGYIPKFKPLSSAFLGLVILEIALKDGQGFFSQLSKGLSSTDTPVASNTTTSLLPGTVTGTTSPNGNIGSGGNTPYSPNIAPFNVSPNGLLGFPPNVITPQIAPGA